MLKIKDNKTLEKIVKDYDMEYEADNDYEMSIDYAYYYKDGIMIDCKNLEISSYEGEDLTILYNLIQSGLVEKVEE